MRGWQKEPISTEEFPNPHVGISKSPRRKEKIPTEGRNDTSEDSNETSEEFFRPHVENKK